MAPEVINKRRIWWIDNGLIVLYLIFYQSTARRFLDLAGSIVGESWWSLVPSLFVYILVTLFLFAALRSGLDMILDSGRRTEFLPLLKYLLIVSVLLSTLTVLLVYAASKTAEIIF
jgi:hypothetical protein